MLSTLNHGDYRSCVHCGLCLPQCPTYDELGDENDSPRGRIYLMQAVDQGRLKPTARVLSHLDGCLNCRACESVCPSGVPYGHLLESFRSRVPSGKATGTIRRLLSRATLWLFPHPIRLRRLQRLLQLAAATGLTDFLSKSGLTGDYAAHLELPGVWSRTPPASPPVYTMPESGSARRQVAVFLGCVSEAIFGQTNRATRRVLLRNQCSVSCPAGQVCCGAMHYHAGQVREAAALARINIAAFEACAVAPSDIVVNVAGCGLMMKEYDRLLQDDPQFAARAGHFSARVRDANELLANLPLDPPQASLPLRVTYHDPCHLCHGQGIRRPPREVLEAIPDLQLLNLVESEWCCGAAGTYSLNQPEMARRLAERKLRHVASSGAEILATANAGCILHLQLHAARRCEPLTVCHTMDLLDRAYRLESAVQRKHPGRRPGRPTGGPPAARSGRDQS